MKLVLFLTVVAVILFEVLWAVEAEISEDEKKECREKIGKCVCEKESVIVERVCKELRNNEDKDVNKQFDRLSKKEFKKVYKNCYKSFAKELEKCKEYFNECKKEGKKDVMRFLKENSNDLDSKENCEKVFESNKEKIHKACSEKQNKEDTPKAVKEFCDAIKKCKNGKWDDKTK